MDMVERVARALYEHGTNPLGYSWNHADEGERQHAIGYAHAAIEAIRSTETGEWQLIETAPKGGNRVLLGGGYYTDESGGDIFCPMVARWVEWRDESLWLIANREAGCNYVDYKNPTHWMPLPPPPSSSALSSDTPADRS